MAVTSDFIVGFCGETDEDFEQTIDLVRESRFKNSFIFKYSERPGTKGAELYPDDVPDEVKRRRNNEFLLPLQNQICEEDNQAFLGREVTVLVEGPEQSGREARATAGDRLQLTGRTHCDRIVVFEGNRRQVGRFLPVVVYDANAHTLFGEVVTEHVGPEVFDLSLPLAAVGSEKESTWHWPRNRATMESSSGRRSPPGTSLTPGSPRVRSAPQATERQSSTGGRF